jgi:hypothetical protein
MSSGYDVIVISGASESPTFSWNLWFPAKFLPAWVWAFDMVEFSNFPLAK